jgi:glycosyltransferase involved in cell wall biosynthesis
MILLSFIIPIYNTEKYLEQCIDSVLHIDSDEYEIILIVEKTSPDNCINICNNYLRKNKDRVTIIVTDDKNLSDARNLGINHAKGRYLFFLDSDDYIDAKYFYDFFRYLHINGSDIVFLSTWPRLYDNNSVIGFDSININHKELTPLQLYKFHMCRKDIFTCAQMFVVKRDYLINKECYFLKGIYHEDELYVIKLITDIKYIRVYHDPLYIQRCNRIESLSSDTSSKGPSDKILIIDILLRYIDENSISLDFNSMFIIKSRLSQLWTGIFFEVILFDITDDEKDELLFSLETRKHVLKYSMKMKHFMLYYLITTLGIKRCYSLFKYLKLKPYRIK